MAEDPAEALRTYAAVYLREEVQWEGLVRNAGSFARFLESVSFSQASVLNVADIARDCSVERKTVAAYLEIVDDLLLAFRLPVFTRRAKRETSVHPKFYYFDAGVFRSLRPRGPLDRPDEIDGAALETLVAQHIRAWIGLRHGDETLSFWRTRSGVEVDFVVYGEREFTAIEVKNAARLRPEDLRGLRAFGEEYPEARRLLLYRGSRRFVRDGVPCWPVEDFLLRVHPDAALCPDA
jgi:predicted AAA+ superfamily ATPase